MMEAHLTATHEEMIFIIEEGPIKIIKVNTATRIEGQPHAEMLEKDHEQWTTNNRKRANLENIANSVLFVTLDKDTCSKRIMMEAHLTATHEEMIFIIEEGPIKIIKVNTATRIEGQPHAEMLEKDHEQWTTNNRKRANLENIANSVLFVTLDKDTCSKQREKAKVSPSKPTALADVSDRRQFCT
ncbi:hypothetical protein OROHE_008982 [Orobanche hederae]